MSVIALPVPVAGLTEAKPDTASKDFTLNFKDMINGCWADFEIETSIVQDECDYTQLLSDTAENFYDIDSNGDFIINN